MKHDWKQVRYEAGYKKQRCTRCGAIKECFNMYIRNADKWTPATLNGKRQPYCPLANSEGGR